MIKKTYLSLIFAMAALLFSALPACALRWGVFDDYIIRKDDYAMHKIINNIPIKYYFTEEISPSSDNNNQQLSQQLNNTLSKEQRESDLQNIIKIAFNVWLKDTKNIINMEGRSQEFNDIMPILSGSVKMLRVNNKKEADLFISFTTKENQSIFCESQSADACFDKRTRELVFVNPFINNGTSLKERKQKILAITIHELGHYLGFTDQYMNLKNSDATYSTADRFGHADAVMAASYTQNLLCDDVDGFINLIDLTLALENNGKFSTRAQKGWASFCNDKSISDTEIYYNDIFYKEAKVKNKQDYHSKDCLYSYNEEGNIDTMICPTPFNFYKKELSYNASNVITNTKDSDFAYSYVYSNSEGEKIQIGYTAGYKVYYSYKKEINGKPSWTLESGYDIYEYPKEGYISINAKECSIHNYIPDTDFIGYNLTFNDNRLYGNYSYIFVVNSLNPLPMKVKVRQSGNCTFELCNFKSAKNIDEGKCVDIFQDDNAMQTIINNTGLDYQNLVKQTEEICNTPLSQDVINNAKALCKYYNEAENYFNMLREEGKTIDFIPRIIKKKGK